MKIPADVAQIRYALAHVRLYAHTDPAPWRVDALLDAFALLPVPAVRFEDWLVERGLEVSTLQDENEAALKSLKGVLPDA